MNQTFRSIDGLLVIGLVSSGCAPSAAPMPVSSSTASLQAASTPSPQASNRVRLDGTDFEFVCPTGWKFSHIDKETNSIVVDKSSLVVRLYPKHKKSYKDSVDELHHLVQEVCPQPNLDPSLAPVLDSKLSEFSAVMLTGSGQGGDGRLRKFRVYCVDGTPVVAIRIVAASDDFDKEKANIEKFVQSWHRKGQTPSK